MKVMPMRRLEDRIRQLCTQALSQTGPDWITTVRELQSAIQEHALRVSNLTTAATIARKPHLVRERRTN
jgi:hypothetical protein